MKAWLIAGAGLVLMSGVGAAVAQAPATPPGAPPPGGPAAEAPGPHGPMGGPMGGPMEGHDGFGWRHRRMAEMMRHMPPPPPPNKAAHFRLRREGALIDIKCAEDEPMKACVDAASALLDKAAAQQR